MIACLRHPQLTEDPVLDPLHAAPEPTDSADYTSAPTVTRRMSAWGTEVKAPILSDGKKSSSSKSSQGSLGGRYLSGRGVPQDFVLVHMWYNLGAFCQGCDRIWAAKESPDRIGPRSHRIIRRGKC